MTPPSPPSPPLAPPPAKVLRRISELGNRDWTGAVFENVTFVVDAEVVGANFTGAKFVNVDLRGVVFRSAEGAPNRFNDARFVDSDLRGARFVLESDDAARHVFDSLTTSLLLGDPARPCQALPPEPGMIASRIVPCASVTPLGYGARYVDVLTMAKTMFLRSDLSGAEFRGSYLTSAVFDASNISGALFQHVVFQSTDLVNLTATGARFLENVFPASIVWQGNYQGALFRSVYDQFTAVRPGLQYGYNFYILPLTSESIPAVYFFDPAMFGCPLVGADLGPGFYDRTHTTSVCQ